MCSYDVWIFAPIVFDVRMFPGIAQVAAVRIVWLEKTLPAKDLWNIKGLAGTDWWSSRIRYSYSWTWASVLNEIKSFDYLASSVNLMQTIFSSRKLRFVLVRHVFVARKIAKNQKAWNNISTDICDAFWNFLFRTDEKIINVYILEIFLIWLEIKKSVLSHDPRLRLLKFWNPDKY